jgi:hypothetical protein
MSVDARPIQISRDSLIQEREIARRLIADRNLPRLFGEIDGGEYGMTHVEIDLLEALETGLAVLIECTKQGRNFLGGDRSDEQRDRFVALYSLFASATVVLEALVKLAPGRVRVSGNFDLDDVEKLAAIDGIAAAVLDDYLQYLRFYRQHPDMQKRVDRDERLVNCTRAYFSLLANSVRTLAVDALFAPQLEAIGRIPHDILGRRFNGFESAAVSASEATDLLDVHLEDIVGNTDFISAGLRLARDVAGFDLEVRQNPKRLNPVLFALGDPGCGKTVTCHAIGSYFLEYCRQRDIPARFVVIRRTDWASSYQNASAQQLIEIFREKVAEFHGVVCVYWPDIDTAFAAREDAGLRSEEKNVLGACFGIFDGTIIPKNGQWFMLCDANTLNMDRATVSRISQDPFHLRGPISADDFVKLLRDTKLRKHGAFLPLSEEEWQALGQLCVDAKLSGRSVENITRKIISEIEDFEYPDAYFKADMAERLEIIRQCSKPVPAARIREIIEHYTRFEKEAEERARRQKFEDRVKEIVFNMSTQAAALSLGDK